MQSKNKKPATAAEKRHIEQVKSLPCSVCGAFGNSAFPNEAHEINQGQWYTSVALCSDCHRGGFNGIHGQKRIWMVKKMDEMDALNETLRAILDN